MAVLPCLASPFFFWLWQLKVPVSIVRLFLFTQVLDGRSVNFLPSYDFSSFPAFSLLLSMDSLSVRADNRGRWKSVSLQPVHV